MTPTTTGMAVKSPESQAVDAELMRRLAGGDRRALAAIYERYCRMVSSVLFHYAPWLSGEENEDIGQEVFLGLLERSQAYEERGRFRSYLCAIAIRRARALRRRRLVRQALFAPWASLRRSHGRQGGTPHEALETRDALDRALAKLSPALLEVVQLKAVEDFDTEEIAAALGVSPNVVRTRLHRARQVLEAAMRGEG